MFYTRSSFVPKEKQGDCLHKSIPFIITNTSSVDIPSNSQSSIYLHMTQDMRKRVLCHMRTTKAHIRLHMREV